jgi:hypothetical protein
MPSHAGIAVNVNAPGAHRLPGCEPSASQPRGPQLMFGLEQGELPRLEAIIDA